MNTDDRIMLVDAAEKLFAVHCMPQLLVEADPNVFPTDLWMQLGEIGLLDMLVPESLGGIAADAASFAAVLRVAGRLGAPGPIAETMIARRLIAQTGCQTNAPVVVALDGWMRQGSEISATVRCGPDAGDAALVILPTQEGTHIGLIPLQRFTKTASRNIAGEAMWVLKGDSREILDVAHQHPASFANETADLLSLARAALIVGALEKTMQLSLTYAGERVQFGRPIGKFQARLPQRRRSRRPPRGRGTLVLTARSSTPRAFAWPIP
jgi:acyl-CoA dehydrogenase